MIPTVAIDFETANGNRGSVCSIGMVSYDLLGNPIEEYSTFVKPHESVGHFQNRNIQVHGITPDMVSHAPVWGDIINEVVDFIHGKHLVAHNAPFERSVLNNLAHLYGTNVGAPGIGCTLKLSRELLKDSLESKKLTSVYSHLFPGKPLLNHHEALDDSYMCGSIFYQLARQFGVSRNNISWGAPV